MENIDLVRKYTRLLKQKYENQIFKKDYDSLVSFYYEKLKNCSEGLDEEKDKWILERLNNVFNLQFLQGYMMFDELYHTNSDLFGIPEGSTYDDIYYHLPSIIKDLFAEHQKEIGNSSEINVFVLDVLTAKGDIILNEALEATLKEFLYYGMCHAFIDKYKDVLQRTDWVDLQSWRGISFLVPQVFMLPNGERLNDYLTFDLFGWPGAPLLANKWLGKLEVNPYDTEKSEIYANVLLADELSVFDKKVLLDLINGTIINTLRAANNQKPFFLNVYHISKTESYLTKMQVEEV